MKTPSDKALKFWLVGLSFDKNDDGEKFPVHVEKTDDDEVLMTWGKGEDYHSIYFSLKQLRQIVQVEL